MKKKNFLYTHNDMDGIVSALLIKAVMKIEHNEDVTVEFCDYSSDFNSKASDGYARVMFTDFVPNDLSVVEEIAENCFEVMIIDHHASKIDGIKEMAAKHKNINHYLAEDEGCSAAMMVFKLCFPGRQAECNCLHFTKPAAGPPAVIDKARACAYNRIG